MMLLATPPARYGHTFASVGTAASLASILTIALLSRYIALDDTSSSTISNHGRIRENHVHLHHHHSSSSMSRELYVEDTSSFTSRPCEDIFDGVPNTNANATDDDDEVQQRQERYLCHYARHCHGGWPSTLLLPLILCRDVDASAALPSSSNHEPGHRRYSSTTNNMFRSSVFVRFVLPPLTLCYLYLLFRLLATTADSFFSPALETFSFELGLPPRFAGATLLALGNGSPDLGSTINAILLWNESAENAKHSSHDKPPGWTICLGSLTGGGMFVGTVVSGLIIRSCDGIPCRGALVRDVSMYALSILTVWHVTESHVVTRKHVWIMLALWVGYVTSVLAADLYHRKITLPRLHAEGRERRNSLLMEKRQRIVAAANRAVTDTIQNDDAEEMNESTPLGTSLRTYTTNNETTVNGDDNEGSAKPRDDNEGSAKPRLSLSTADRFAMLMSNYDPASVKFSYSPRSSSGLSNDDASETTLIHDIIHEIHEGHHPSATIPKGGDENSCRNNVVENNNRETLHSFPEGMEDEESVIDDEGVNRSCSINLISEAYQEIVYEAGCYWQNRYKDEPSRLEKFGFLLELPITIVRTLTIPVPCEDHYNRVIVALSTAISPCWMLWYFKVTDFSLKSMIFCVTTSIVAFGVLRYGSDEKLPPAVAAPLSLYGFLIAATWIDVIGDNLVGLLQFLGTICRIPAPILGVTVLAWGNSLGDLSANVAMARKGMPDMATTANFAGPSFNMLLGVGFGFLALQNKLETSTISPVSLNKSIRIGFGFNVMNCFLIILFAVFCGWRIPRQYSFVLFLLYFLFIATSLMTLITGE